MWWMSGVVNVWCGGCLMWWMSGVVDVCVVDVVQSNSASRRARGGLKKENSSEFNPEECKQVKSSPPLKVWLHKGSNLNPKMAQ